MTRPRRAVAALAATAALAVTGLAPAAAVDWVHQDATGDVRTVTLDENSPDEPEFVLDPGNLDTDITQVVVRHRARSVALRMTLRDIRRSSGAAVFLIRTDGPDFFAIKSLGRREFTPGWMLARANGRLVRCPDARRYVLRDTDEAVARIPRTCLGTPRWIRVGAAAQSIAETATTLTVALDDGLGEGEFEDRLVMSPRVHRGLG